jgi:hypothetical protein
MTTYETLKLRDFGRDAQFSLTYGSMCCIKTIINDIPDIKLTCSNEGCVKRNFKIFKRRSTTEQDLRDVVRWCEKSIVYRLAEKTGNDVAFYMGVIGLEAVDRRGDDGVTYSHDYWDLLDEHGKID